MKNPKILYILIAILCAIAIVAGIYAQFFVKEEDKDDIILPQINNVNEEIVEEPTTKDILNDFESLFTNEFNVENYDFSNIDKLDESKDIIYSAYDINEKKENYEMNIHLPVMNIKGDVPMSFNKITQEVFADKASEIMSDTEAEDVVYEVDYVAYVNGDILSLVIKGNLKEKNKAQRVMIQTYNYDMKTGEKIKISDVLQYKELILSEVQEKINEVVQKGKDEAQALEEFGVYTRDLSDTMYKVKNVTTYFLGPDESLYIIFAYGNKNYTSEMDIVLYE